MKRWATTSGTSRALIAASLLLLVLGGAAHGATIFSEGFEAPVVSGKVDTDFTDWFDVSRAGPWNEDTALITTPYGAQVAWLFLGGVSSYRLETTGITDTLTAGMLYTLTCNVGNCRSDTGNPVAGIGYTIQLIAGSTVVASTTGTTSTDDMSETASFEFAPPPGHPNLGETLKIRLFMSSGDWHASALFDNLVLDATDTSSDVTPPSPDPPTWDLLPKAITEDSIYMRCNACTDDNNVQYYFENTTLVTNSGWIDDREWTDTGLTPGTTYSYRVKARDLSAKPRTPRRPRG